MSAVDPHTARLAQMVHDAYGAADIAAVLAAKGYTAAEVTDNLFEVTQRCADLATIDGWRSKPARWMEEGWQDKDKAEGDLYL